MLWRDPLVIQPATILEWHQRDCGSASPKNAPARGRAGPMLRSAIDKVGTIVARADQRRMALLALVFLFCLLRLLEL